MPAKPERSDRPKGLGKEKSGRKPGPKGQSELHNKIRDVLKPTSETAAKLLDLADKVPRNGYQTTPRKSA